MPRAKRKKKAKDIHEMTNEFAANPETFFDGPGDSDPAPAPPGATLQPAVSTSLEVASDSGEFVSPQHLASAIRQEFNYMSTLNRSSETLHGILMDPVNVSRLGHGDLLSLYSEVGRQKAAAQNFALRALGLGIKSKACATLMGMAEQAASTRMIYQNPSEQALEDSVLVKQMRLMLQRTIDEKIRNGEDGIPESALRPGEEAMNIVVDDLMADDDGEGE